VVGRDAASVGVAADAVWVANSLDAVEAVMTALKRSGATAGADCRALQEALGSAEANLVGGRIRLGNLAAIVWTNVLSPGWNRPA
jgi:ABC-type branched-subunit amino acid transport system substrate-binding protein